MTTDAVGGVWRYTIDLGRALLLRGVRTTIAAMGPAPSARQLQEVSRAGLDIAVRSCRLEWMPEPWDDVQRVGTWLLALERSIRPNVVHLNGYVHAALPWTAPVVVVAHSCVRTWWRAVKTESPLPSELGTYTTAVRSGLTAARVVIAPTQAMADGLLHEYGACCRPKI